MSLRTYRIMWIAYHRDDTEIVSSPHRYPHLWVYLPCWSRLKFNEKLLYAWKDPRQAGMTDNKRIANYFERLLSIYIRLLLTITYKSATNIS
jgi:hypothetical protein